MKRPGKKSRTGRKRKKLAERIPLWLNIPAAVALLASWSMTWVDPAGFWPAAFIAMAYPVTLVINLVFILYWMFRFRRLVLISLLPVLLGAGLASAYFRIGTDWMRPGREIPGTLNILTYNVHGFDKNRFYTEHSAEPQQSIVDWLSRAGADIIFMQEFYTNESRDFNMLDTCNRKLEQKHLAKGYYRDDWHTLFLVTYSSYPIGMAGKLRDDDGRGFALWTDISAGGDTLRFINVHLRSNRLSHEMGFLEGTAAGMEYFDENARKDARSLLRKMKEAFIARSAQSRKLREFIDDSSYPVVLCGDLNDTPASFTYRLLSKGMRDSFRSSGSGLAGTYLGKLPSFRIDYILVDKRISVLDYRRHDISSSDHYPLSASIRYKE